MTVDCIKREIALGRLRDCLGHGGHVMYGPHFRDELAREGLAIPDAWLVMRSGQIYDPPEPDIKTGEWKYRVEGHTADGTWIAIVFCFKAVDRAFLITVFSVENKKRTTL